MKLGAVIPIKNESGNVKEMVRAAKNLPTLSRIIFIDGKSSDNTVETLINCINEFGDQRMSILVQEPPYNKFSAVKQAIKVLDCDHVLVWDGDNTIQFEDVKKMIQIYLSETKVNTVFLVANRLTNLRESKSFRIINLIGNHISSIMMIPILSAYLKDVLSGVKIFPIKLINSKNCSTLTELDLFGDVSLLAFGRKLTVRFIQYSCNYKNRTYGTSKISRLSGGVNIIKSILHLYFHRCFHA